MSQLTERNTKHVDVMRDLRTFIEGATKTTTGCNAELTKTALSLLKALPSTRDAVLNYFCTVFNNATQNFVVRIETEIATGNLPPASEEDETVVSEIHSVICSFVSSRPEAWAPIISTWSLELLGELSTKYAGRAHVSTVSVNETLQLWMSCRPTRTLIDITTLCLSSLIHSDTEACINALLDTSVKHSPNFDWVVAHVGSCFPTTVITRVLSCGLKDFCQNKSYEQGCDSPKLKSVVGILGHLAVGHCQDICKALLDLFKWSFTPTLFSESEDVKLLKKKTVPFLLQLANFSSTLLLALSKNIKATLSLEVVTKMNVFVDDWIKYFGSRRTLRDFIVRLIMKCAVGAFQIITILLDCIFIDGETSNDANKSAIKNSCGEILEYVLLEIDVMLRKRVQEPTLQINVLDSCMCEVLNVNKTLLSPQIIKSQTASKLIIFMGHTNPSILVKSCVFLIENAETMEHLAVLLKILTNELLDKAREPYTSNGGHFGVVLSSILSEPLLLDCENNLMSLKLFSNLFTLLKWEKSDRIPLLRSKLVSKAIYVNLSNIIQLFNSGLSDEVLHVIANLLDTLEVPSLDMSVPHTMSVQELTNLPHTMSVQELTNFTMATINYFFVCCNEQDGFQKLLGLKRTNELLKRLCLHSKVAKMTALRELLERAIFSNEKYLFGSINEVATHRNTYEKLLVEQNRKNIKTIPLTKNSSTLNGGIIGNGRRNSIDYSECHSDSVTENMEHFIKAIKACCALPPNEEIKNVDLSLESLTSLSLLLVQFVSPDVMYNGLPWPEEEFYKVTIERDFYIRRLFTNNPLLWKLLAFIAVYRPTLCYCSVLLRAITATLIQQWNGTSDKNELTNTNKYNSIVHTTVKVIEVMSLGQLLLPPLTGIRDVIPHLKCSEIVQILRDCVWNYMRDHVPSPALFTCNSLGIYWRDSTVARPPEIYTTTLRIIMQNNIKSVGHLYSHMFTNIPPID